MSPIRPNATHESLLDNSESGIPHPSPFGDTLAGDADGLESRRTFGARSLGTDVAPASFRCGYLAPLLPGIDFVGHARFGAGDVRPLHPGVDDAGGDGIGEGGVVQAGQAVSTSRGDRSMGKAHGEAGCDRRWKRVLGSPRTEVTGGWQWHWSRQAGINR